MTALSETLDYVLRKITPTQAEKNETRDITERVKKVAGGIIKPYGISLTIAGSYVRDTWLPNKKEFDLFLLFPEWYSREDLEKKGLSIGKRIVSRLKGKYVVAYAEHPYVRATIERFDVDIVPCFKVESATKIRSAVDRTPFHNEWLSRNLGREQSGDVRLLKQFCKGQGIYGSDTKTQGFSGYLCELMVVHFGSFEKLLREVSEWEPGIVLDPEGHHDEPEKLRKRFKKDPMIMIDPVDPNRNVAAAVSPGNFMRLVESSRMMLSKPGTGFFFRTPKKVSARNLAAVMKKRGTQILVVCFRRPDVIDDTLWPQLRKSARRLNDVLHDYEFGVMGWDALATEMECFLLLELSIWKLPSVRKLRGPDIFSGKRVTEFKRKYSGPGRVWIEGEYWFAEVKREFTNAEKKLREFLRGHKKELHSKGVPSYVAEAISGRYALLGEAGIVKKIAKDRMFAEFLREYFEREMI